MNGLSSAMAADVDGLLTLLERSGIASVVSRATEAREQLREPLRVAVAGRVKAGKSTLINALAGAAIAATDTTECTQLVTWYRHGPTPKAAAIMTEGMRTPLPYHQESGRAWIDVEGLAIERVVRLDVELPLEVLRTLTIIDTPGTVSISEHLSARAIDFLLSEDDPTDAPDVVLYLMRHAHEQDFQFLEAYGKTLPSDADPLRAIGVLSRADEIGSGRADAMGLAAQLASDLSDDLAAMVTSVLPAAGLLAFAAVSLDRADFDHLRQLAGLPYDRLDTLLRSASCFAHTVEGVPVDPAPRIELLDKLGLFGVRTAVGLLALGDIVDLDGLRASLRHASGIETIEALILGQFVGRSDVLRAARATSTLAALIEEVPDPELRRRVDRDLDEVRANAFELREVGLLRDLSLQTKQHTTPAERAVIVQTLGGRGHEPFQRLGAAPAAGHEELHALLRQRKSELLAIPSPRGAERRAIEFARDISLANVRRMLDEVGNG